MKEKAEVGMKVKKIRLEKFDNDENGKPIRNKGPVEVWEGTDESNMKLVHKRGED
jgi:hypothetical protein